ncbi:hypothetical protein GTY75_08700 [Streptomyces sp. SID8381]|uniref:hypothetical protein n=1 Tax=unclassified Streptomyces TaxID=2593676 RepID=UPI00035CC371|nr:MULTISPECIES: hypothetical protein [unclassified Streptomyces]MYX26747.1 hypothetical protein [Streptomyces sp. SID8381]
MPASGTDIAATTTSTPAAREEPEAEPEPPADAPASDRLAYYERIVHRERELYRDTVAAADQRFVERAHVPLYQINRQGLYLHRISEVTGKPFTRFKDYLLEVWGISRAHGYRIVNEYPVVKALAPLGAEAPDKLSTRQVPKLLGVLRSRGADDWSVGEEAVRTVWTQSESKTPAGLQETIDKLGWGDPQAEALDDLSESERERKSLVEKWDQVTATLDPAKARQLLERSPDEAKRLLDKIKPFVEVLEEVSQLPAPKGKRRR